MSTMPPFSTVWQYYTTEQWTDNEGRVRRTSTCNFCNKTYRSNATKMTLHLVKQCRPCPEHVKLELGRLVDDGSHDEVEVALVIPQPVIDSNNLAQPSSTAPSPVTSQPITTASPPKPIGIYKSITPSTRPHSRWFKDTKAVWKHFVTETHTDEQGNTRSTSYCMYCNLRYTFPNVTKMRKHLLVKCRQCPQEVIEEVGGGRLSGVGSASASVSTIVGGSGTPNIQLQRWNPPSTITTPNDSPSTSIQLSRPPQQAELSTSTQNESPATEHASESQSTSQGPPPAKRQCLELPQPVKKTHPLKMTPGENKKVDEAIARAVYSSDTPLNFSENSYWKEAFKILRITYTPPTKSMLTGELLDEEYKRVSGKVVEKLCTATSVAIISDGWSSSTGQNRINFTVSTPQPVFLKSIQTKENQHSAASIAATIIGVIQEVGPAKVLLVLTDNTSENMIEAWKLITAQFSHITTGGCAGYTLRNLLDNILNIDTLKELCEKVRNIVLTIKGSYPLYEILKTKQEEKQQKLLYLPNKLQHGGTVLMMESLLACKDSLAEIVTQEDLKVDVEISSKLLDGDNFWMPVESCMEILQPITSALTKITSPKALLSDILQEFSKIMSNLAENLEKSPLTSDEKVTVQQAIEESRSLCCFPVHAAANLLDPRYRGQTLNEDDIAGAMDFVIRQSLHLNLDAGKVMASLAEFQAQEGRLWSMPSIWAAADHTDPSIWWKGMCGTQKIMPIASSLLSILPTSSASMKRRCSSGDNLDNLRGQLNDVKKQKIVAIRANLHLFREGYHNFCDNSNYEEEDSNSHSASDSEDQFVTFKLN